jgi:hypothetical protein
MPRAPTLLQPVHGYKSLRDMVGLGPFLVGGPHHGKLLHEVRIQPVPEAMTTIVITDAFGVNDYREFYIVCGPGRDRFRIYVWCNLSDREVMALTMDCL